MSIKEAVILNCPRCGTKVRLWVPDETLSKWTAGEELACIKCTKRFLIRVDGEGDVHVMALQKIPANGEAAAPAPKPAAAAAPKPTAAPAPKPAAAAPPKPAAPKPAVTTARPAPPKPAPPKPAVTTAHPVATAKPVNTKQSALREAEMNEAAAKEALLVAQQAALAAKQAAVAAKEALAKQSAAREAAAAAAAPKPAAPPKPTAPPKPKYTGPMYNILFVDNDALASARVQNTVKAESINLTVAKNFDDAIELAKRKQYDLIISDLYLQNIPGADGESLLKRIMAFSGKATPAIMTSEKQLYDDVIADPRWFDLKVKGFVEKASQGWADDLKAKVREVLGVNI